MHQNIIIIDDNKEFCEELQVTLETSGYIVKFSTKPEEIMKTVSKQLPDIILMVFNMSEISGFNLISQLKTNPVTAIIPIIAMTGFYNKKKNIKNLDILKQWNIKCLKKPFNPLDIISSIEGY